MNLYVGAKWRLRDQVREIYRQIEARGHEITEKWTEHKAIKPYDQHPEISREYAIKDIEGVRACDVFVLLTDEDGIGMYIEIGGAIMSHLLRGKPDVYVIGKQQGRSMFFFLPFVKLRNTIEDVLEELESS